MGARRSAAALLVLAAFLTFLNFVVRIALPPVLPLIERDLNLSHATAGAALALLTLAYAVGHSPGGWLADRRGPTQALAPAFALLGGASFLIGAADGLGLLLLGMGLLGLGAGAHFSAGSYWLTELFPHARARALGVNLIGASLAGVVGAALSPWVAHRLGWRAIFLGFAPPLFAMTAILMLLSRGPVPRLRSSSSPAPPSGRRASPEGEQLPENKGLGLRRLGAVLLPTALLMMANQALATFLPTYLHEAKGLSLQAAGLGLAGMFGIGAVAQPLCGALADRYGRERVAVLLLWLSAAALLALSRTPPGPVMFAAVALAGAGVRGYVPVIEALLFERLPAGRRGTGFGLSRTLYFLAGSLGPALFGWGADRFGFEPTLSAFAALLGLAGLLLGRPHLHKKRAKRVQIGRAHKHKHEGGRKRNGTRS